MDVNYEKSGTVIIFNFSGIFEYPDESKLINLMQKAIVEKPAVIAVNLLSIDSINSAGIAALLSMLKIADENNIEFVLYGMNQKVLHLLEKVFSHDLIPLLTEEEFTSEYL